MSESGACHCHTGTGTGTGSEWLQAFAAEQLEGYAKYLPESSTRKGMIRTAILLLVVSAGLIVATSAEPTQATFIVPGTRKDASPSWTLSDDAATSFDAAVQAATKDKVGVYAQPKDADCSYGGYSVTKQNERYFLCTSLHLMKDGKFYTLSPEQWVKLVRPLAAANPLKGLVATGDKQEGRKAQLERVAARFPFQPQEQTAQVLVEERGLSVAHRTLEHLLTKSQSKSTARSRAKAPEFEKPDPIYDDEEKCQKKANCYGYATVSRAWGHPGQNGGKATE